MALVRTGIELELAGFQKFVQGLAQVERAQQTLKQNTERATNALSVFELALSAFGATLGKAAVGNLDAITKSIAKFNKAFVGFKNVDVGETELKAKLDLLAKSIVNSASSFDALNKAAASVSSEQVRLLGESVRKFVFAFQSLFALENFNTGFLKTKLDEIKTALNNTQKEFVELGNAAKLIATTDIEKLGTSLKTFTDSIKTIVTMKGLGDLGNNLKIITTNLTSLNTSLTNFSNSLNFSNKLKTIGDALKDLVSGIRSVINIKGLPQLPQNISLIIRELNTLELALSTFGAGANIAAFSTTINAIGESFKVFASGFRSLLNIKNFNELPLRLQEISTSLGTLYQELSKLNTVTGFYDDFDTLAKAFQRLAAGTRSLVNINKIQQLPVNIKYIVDALKTLKAADIDQMASQLERLAQPLRDLAIAARELRSLKDAEKAGLNLKQLSNGLEESTPLMKAFIFVAKGFGTLSFNVIKASIPYFLQLGKAVSTIAITGLTKTFQLLFNVLVKNPISFVINLFNNFINTVGNLIRALGNLLSFVVRLGGVFGSNNNSIKQQNDSFKQLESTSNAATNELQQLINVQSNASGSTDQLTTDVRQLNSETNNFKTDSFKIFGRDVDQLHPRLINLAAALTSLNVVGNVLSRTFQTLSNSFRTVGTDAISAIKNAENLQLQISTLQARELVQTGQFDDINAAMDQAQINAKELISDFKLLAQITPFETNDLVAAFKQLQTFGFLTDDAVNLTKIISTIPGITGDALRDIATVFGQIRTSGKLSQQDLRQLTDRGIDVAGAFRKAYEEIEGGAISAAEAMEWAKEGGLSTNDAIAAIAKSIGQDFAGSLSLSAQTTEALFSSIKSLKDEALVNLFGPVLEQSKVFLNNLIAIGNQPEVMQYLRDLGTVIGGYLATAIDNVISVIGGLIAVWRDIPPETKALIGQFAQFAAITIGVTVALSALQAVLGVAVFAFGVLVNPVSIVVGAMVGMGIVFKNNEEIINTWANNAINTINNFANNITAFVNLLFTDFEAALTAVVDFGSGLISAFVDGIISAFNLVATAMQQLGDLIAFWLQPGSPPRVLPDIDDWGTAAANEFLQGFTIADFNYIKDFGSTVENLLESINIEGVDTSALSNLFAKALDDINTTGTVDMSAVFEQIEQIAPDASTEVKNLAEQYLNVIQQTKALNAATNQYGDAINALNDIEDSETLANEEKRIKSLTEFTRSQYITEDQRKNALNQIAKIQQGQLIRQAEKQLKQAESELDATKAKIDLANQFKDETVDATDALESSSESGNSLKEKLKKATEEAGSIADKLGGLSDIELPGFDSAGAGLGSLTDIIDNLENPLDGLMDKFETAKTNIENAVKPLLTLFDTLRANSELVIVSLSILATVLAGPKIIGAFQALSIAIAPLVSVIGLPALAAGLLAVGGAIIFANTEFGRQTITKVLDDIGEAFTTFERRFTTNDVYEIVDEFVKVDLSSLKTMGETLGINASVVKNRIDAFAQTIVDGFNTAYRLVKAGVNPLDAVAIVLDNATFDLMIKRLIENLRTSITNIITEFPNTLRNLRTSLVNSFNTFVTTISQDIPAAFSRGFNIGSLDTVAYGITLGIAYALSDVRSKLTNLPAVTGFLDSLISAFVTNDRSNAIVDITIALTNAISQAIKDIRFDINDIQTAFSQLLTDIFGDIDLGPVEIAFRAIKTSFDLLIANLNRVGSDGNTELSNLIESSKNLIINIGRAAAAIGAILSVLALSILPELPDIFNDIIKFGGGIIGFIADVLAAIIDFSTGQITFVEALKTIFSSFIKNLDIVFSAIDSLSGNIIDIISNLLTIVSNALQIDLSKLQKGLESIRPILKFLISSLLLAGLGKFLGLLNRVGGNTLAKVLKAVGKSLTQVAQGAALVIATLLTINFDKATESLNNFFKQLGTYFVELGKWFADSFVNVGKSIGDFISDTASDISWYFDIQVQNIKNFFNAIGDNISDFFEGILTSIGQWLYNTITAIANTVENWKQHVVVFISSVLLGWSTMITAMITAIINLKNLVVSYYTEIRDIVVAAIVEMATNVYNKMVEFATTIIDKIKEIITNAVNTVLTIYDTIRTNIETATTTISTLISSIFEALSQTVTDIINIEWSNPFTDFEGFIDDLITAFARVILSAGLIGVGILTLAKQWADPFEPLQGFIDNIISLILSIVTNVTSMLDSIKEIEWVNPFTDFEGFIQNVIDLAKIIYDTIINVKDDIVAIEWVNPFSGIIDFINDLKIKILGVIATFLTTKAGIQLIKWLDPFSGLITFITNVIDKIIEIKNNVVTVATDIAGYVFNDPFTILTGFITVVTGLITGIVDVFNNVRDSLRNINWSNPFSILTGFIFSVRLAIAGIFTIMKQTALDLLTVVFNDPFTKLSEFIQNIKDAVGTILAYLKQLALDLITVNWQNPFSGLTDHVNFVIDKINLLIDTINKVPGINIPGLGRIGVNDPESGYVQGDANDFSTMLSSLNQGSSMVETGEISLGEFDSVVAKVKEAGLATGEGFIIGFQAAADKWPTDFRNSGDVAVNAIKKHFKIQSPSKLMQDDIGKPLAEGVLLGFKQNFKASEFVDVLSANTTLFKEYFYGIIELEALHYENVLILRTVKNTELLTLLRTFFSTTYDISEDAYNDLLDLADDFSEDLYDLIEDLLDELISIFSNKFDTIISNLSNDLREIEGLFVTFGRNVETTIDRIVENIKNSIERIVTVFETAIGTAITNFIEILDTRLQSETETSLNSIIGNLNYIYVIASNSPWRILGDDMASALVGGIAKGILDRIRDVINAIEKLVREATAAGKKALESKSPSKVAARELGEPISTGIAEGILNKRKSITDSLGNVLTGMNTELELFYTKLAQINTNGLSNDIFDTSSPIVSGTATYTDSLLSGLSSLVDANNRMSDISTRNISQQSSNSFVRTNNRTYNLYMSVEPNQVTNVNRNFKVMEYLGI